MGERRRFHLRFAFAAMLLIGDMLCAAAAGAASV